MLLKVSMLLSVPLTLSSPLAVSIACFLCFSMSALQIRQYHLSRFRIYVLVYDIYLEINHFKGAPGCQASSREEAKDSAVLPSRDADILEPPERPQAK